ncbi:hypothetical protein AALP_AA7G021200 [Arabis alpina]|uniref:Brf1 TBP-binding domain-containing protein n=1 Tax=Arabis alpina TaxID=50452 RepID=A0A087GFG1_ARAAL|nr:hypothetical protein AALP_AA7G021200 [Arabis alpina]
MVEKSVNLYSKNATPVETISRAKLLAGNLKVCGNKGQFDDGDLGEDLCDISDAEVAVHLNSKKEFLLKKIAWEMMNPDYEKGKQRKPTTGKKKEPIKKTAPSKKNSATRTKSNAESENKKRPSLQINYDVLDELFDSENSPKRAKLEKPIVTGDQMNYSQQSSEESLIKPQESEEEELDWNEDYSNENAYNLETEDQDVEEESDNEGIIW